MTRSITESVLAAVRAQPTGPFRRGWNPSMVGRAAGCTTKEAKAALVALEACGDVFRPAPKVLPSRYALTGAGDDDFNW